MLMQGNITAWRREMLQQIHAEEDEEWTGLDFQDENVSRISCGEGLRN